MKNIKVFLILAALWMLMGAVVSYADEPFHSDSDAYRYGYEQGYQHGLADENVDLTFDFRREFPNSDSYYSYINQNFRDGYEEGYKDGYDRRENRQSVERKYPAGQVHHGYSSDGYQRRDQDSIVVFTKDHFEGNSREFAIGRYPDLKGTWNDSIESVQVMGPVRVVLFDKSNYRGQRLIIEQDQKDLDDLNFGEKAASMIVEPLR